MEKHIQTIISSLVLAALLWVGNTLLDVKERIARLEERVLNTSGHLGSLTGRIDRLEERREFSR